jgi:hypothetical protein
MAHTIPLRKVRDHPSHIRQEALARGLALDDPLTSTDVKEWDAWVTEYVTTDSGRRDEFDTGAVRDTREGKGRYDLISPFALRRVAQLYERGAAKYDARNWEKGMPYTRVFDSLVRHAFEWLEGQSAEDHLAAVVFNAMALMHYEATHPELDDRPKWGAIENTSH